MNTIKYTAAVSVDKGLIRNNNEDNFYFNGTYLYADERDKSSTFSQTPSNEIQLYGVFDGMGGEALGEEASLIIAQVISKAHRRLKNRECNIEKEINAAVEGANNLICKKIIDSGERRIGSTFSALVVENDRALIFNVGDSRVYLLRSNKLTQISIDDTTAQRLVDMGEITHEQAMTHKDRHKLTQHLGIFRDEMLIEPHISKKIDIKKDDKFLLCSDGLTDMLTDEEISKILNQNKPCDQLCEDLIKAALKNGGKDNVTAIVVKAQTDKKAQPMKKTIIPLCLAVTLVLGCGVFMAINKNKNEKKSQDDSLNKTNIYFSNPTSRVKIGEENVFMIGVEPANTKIEIKFISSDPNVIEIDEKTGFYRALAPGKTIIRAEAGKIYREMEIQVYKPVDDITNIPDKISLGIGGSKKIQYKLSPNDINEQAVFMSENEEIATVTAEGVVEAHNVGKTNVIISVYDYSEAIEIVVTENKEKSNKN